MRGATGQLISQAPQWSKLVARTDSHPLLAAPSQLAKPLLQLNPQVAEVHTAAAFARAGQTVPHAPQFAELVAVSTHTPLQSVGAPTGQLEMHAPPEQVCPAAQACPQPPQ